MIGISHVESCGLSKIEFIKQKIPTSISDRYLEINNYDKEANTKKIILLQCENESDDIKNQINESNKNKTIN